VQTNVHQTQLDSPFYFLKLYMLPWVDFTSHKNCLFSSFCSIVYSQVFALSTLELKCFRILHYSQVFALSTLELKCFRILHLFFSESNAFCIATLFLFMLKSYLMLFVFTKFLVFQFFFKYVRIE
jgi:hypothetical protein